MSLLLNSRTYHPIIILLINTKVNIQKTNVSQYFNVTHSSTNKTDRHDIIEILFKVALNQLINILTTHMMFSKRNELIM
jgi:hypothetical protein